MRRSIPLLVTLTAACTTGAEKKDAPSTGAARVVPVTVSTVVAKDVPLWLEGLGSVAAWQQVTVRSQVDGRLETVAFKEGDRVAKGQLLAQIDPRPFLVQLHQAEGALARDKAQADAAKLSLERLQDLRKGNLVAQQDVDNQQGMYGQLQGAVRVDEAAIESARLNLDYARVVAPIDGVLGVRQVDPGNLIHAADPTGIVVITQIDPAAVFFTLPEDELGRITEAQKRGPVKLTIWNRDGAAQLGEGEVIVIDNQINQTTATLRLKARVPNKTGALWPNQFVRARMLLDTAKNALVIPAVAVQRGPQGTFVYVLTSDQTVQPRPVTLGPTSGELTVVKRGLEAGERVVVEGQSQLRQGAKVQAKEAAAPSSAPVEARPMATGKP
jgi:multidrug efflux system membrane fusion protein